MPLSHAHDPLTSHEAADRHERSGARQRNADLVRQLAAANPGLTAIECWEAASQEVKAILKEPQEVRRRLTDLARNGAVQQGPARGCRVRGTRQVTWELVVRKTQGALFSSGTEEYR